ncbi:hypothetical protein pEaSNUABM29_00258 [Erwinia phage pEa_SNUABM_29]|nr:hypothetical protein pEaSNUABM29_00258 [Erwinia phage pEa_SNUABM_29]
MYNVEDVAFADAVKARVESIWKGGFFEELSTAQYVKIGQVLFTWKELPWGSIFPKVKDCTVTVSMTVGKGPHSIFVVQYVSRESGLPMSTWAYTVAAMNDDGLVPYDLLTATKDPSLFVPMLNSALKKAGFKDEAESSVLAAWSDYEWQRHPELTAMLGGLIRFSDDIRTVDVRLGKKRQSSSRYVELLIYSDQVEPIHRSTYVLKEYVAEERRAIHPAASQIATAMNGHLSRGWDGLKGYFSELLNADIWNVELEDKLFVANADWRKAEPDEYDINVCDGLIDGALQSTTDKEYPSATAEIFVNTEYSPSDRHGCWAINIIKKAQAGPHGGPSVVKQAVLVLRGNKRIVDDTVASRLPDPELRSVAEPSFLMSSKAVRDAWGNEVLMDWHYDATIAWGKENGWHDVQRIGRQLLFIAKLQLI